MKESNFRMRLKKLYGQINMTWLKIIIFAVCAGVYAGAVMIIPALENTSFRDIGIAFEWWVIFAIIIVVNCQKNWEAMLKCFVFFLVSQPIIYAVEVLFHHITLDQAIYFYRIWAIPTVLTIPGGFVAFYCKKQNMLGTIILGIANTMQLVMGVSYAVQCLRDFPHHILSFFVSIISIFVMTFFIQEKKKNRIIALIFPVIITVILIVLAVLTGRLNF